jgi:hypothetical protein
MSTSRRSCSTPGASPSAPRSYTGGGGVAGLQGEPDHLQPPEGQTDVDHVIDGGIDVETGAIEHYTRIVGEIDQADPVTQDIVID